MTTDYKPLPTPPTRASRTSLRRWVLLSALTLFGIILLHYAILGFRTAHLPPRQRVPIVTEAEEIFAELSNTPDSVPPTDLPSTEDPQSQGQDGPEDDSEEKVDGKVGLSADTLHVLSNLPRGPYVKDAYPIRTMRAFLELAEREIKLAGVETCQDRLSSPLVRDWATTGRQVCRRQTREAELRSSLSPVSAAEGEPTARSGRERRNEAISQRRRGRDSTERKEDLEVTRTGDVLKERGQKIGRDSNEAQERRTETHHLEPGSITCFNPKDARGSSWWTLGSYPCISTGLETSGNASRFSTPLECSLPRSREKYALANVLDHREVECSEWVNTTTVLVHRRDEWNPFHAAEDLLTTLLNLLILGAAEPSLATDRIQLAFSDTFQIAGNHYATLWDSIGAHSPRILSLDPYADKACFRRLVHGTPHTAASILTVIPIHRFSGCASAVTWAGSHYLRYLVGYLPPGLEVASGSERSVSEVVRRSRGGAAGEVVSGLDDVKEAEKAGKRGKRGERGAKERKVIRVLFLSRYKLHKWFYRTRQYSHWRSSRHIYNEPELLDHLAEGLEGLCESGKCHFERVGDEPDLWLSTSTSHTATYSPKFDDAQLDDGLEDDDSRSNDGNANDSVDDKPIIRFTSIDPLLLPLSTQASYLAHTDVVIGSHGGALALTLFTPPGRGAMIELQVDEIFGRNFHFKNLCYQLGRRYKELLVENHVDPGPVWEAVREQVEMLL